MKSTWKLQREQQELDTRLFIVKLAVIAFFLVLLTNITLATYVNDPVAVCPNTGCNFLDKSYYSDFPEDSFKRINHYLNNVK